MNSLQQNSYDCNYSYKKKVLSGLERTFFIYTCTGEIFVYLLWFYIYNLIIGIIVFPVVQLITDSLNINNFWKILICFSTVMILLNVVPYIHDSRMITIDILTGIFRKDRLLLGFNNLGIHLIAITSFIVSYLILQRPGLSTNI